MNKSITTPDSLKPATEPALFDSRFAPIQTEVRAQSRQFIEELIRGDLDTALARPHYARGKMAGNKPLPEVAGNRQGSRTQSLTAHSGRSKSRCHGPH